MLLDIITPDKMIFSGEVSLVQLPGVDGLFEILTRHAPLVSLLTKGRIKAEIDGKMEFFEIEGGVVEVMKDRILVLSA